MVNHTVGIWKMTHDWLDVLRQETSHTTCKREADVFVCGEVWVCDEYINASVWLCLSVLRPYLCVRSHLCTVPSRLTRLEPNQYTIELDIICKSSPFHNSFSSFRLRHKTNRLTTVSFFSSLNSQGSYYGAQWCSKTRQLFSCCVMDTCFREECPECSQSAGAQSPLWVPRGWVTDSITDYNKM